MKTNALLAIAVCSALSLAGFTTHAQDAVVVEETAMISEIPCTTHYYTTKTDNWFIQLGAGIHSPFVENYNGAKKAKHHLTVTYNLGFGKWFSPYFGWRLGFNYGSIHWENGSFMHAKEINANLDVMWDMFNSVGGVNSGRVFSIVPFIGLGGSYVWDFKPYRGNIETGGGGYKSSQWALPLSAGMQLRFRLSEYVDFFAEGRAQFYGDNYNNYAWGNGIDMKFSAIGGFSFNIGGSDFRTYDPCNYIGYIDDLNNRVNKLRGTLATTAAALAAAEAQLPCPEVKEATVIVNESAPLMATVRFRLNSAKISDDEMVNVFNIAEWMKANPGQNVAIVGYADKDTGTSDYNMALSKRRAQAVYDLLVNKYGISPDRLSISAEGSDVQPYDINNWNRIVIFSVSE